MAIIDVDCGVVWKYGVVRFSSCTKGGVYVIAYFSFVAHSVSGGDFFI